MPIIKREELKAGGFAQIRAALQSFEGDCIKAEFGMWGGKLVDDEGNPVPPREFLEVESTNVIPTEVTEELSMDISLQFSFRINCSEATNTIWDRFLESADKAKLLVPKGLIGKRISWRKVTVEGTEPRFTTSNFIIDKVKQAAPKVVKPVVVGIAKPVALPLAQEVADDPMILALGLAIGKTEQQFRSAASLHPQFIGSQLLPLIKAGLASQALIADGKMVLGEDGKYQRVE